MFGIRFEDETGRIYSWMDWMQGYENMMNLEVGDFQPQELGELEGFQCNGKY